MGAEGCWGILLMCALVLPIVYFIPGSDDGHYEYVAGLRRWRRGAADRGREGGRDGGVAGRGSREPADMITHRDALDAAVMIYNSHRLLAFVLLYWLSIAFYNFFGLSVAKQLTAVHRTFIDAVRTIFVCPSPSPLLFLI